MMPCERLTPKEIQVATLVWEGLTNREIGRIIGTSEQVIKNHLRSTFDKLGVWSRLELAMYVASHGGKRWQGDSAHSSQTVGAHRTEDRPVGSEGGPTYLSLTLSTLDEGPKNGGPGFPDKSRGSATLRCSQQKGI